MKHSLRCLIISAALLASSAGADVLQHHRNDSRDGLYVDPLINRTTAANTQRDTTFNAPLPGPTYGQPLYLDVGPGGSPALISATQQNQVLAIDASSGNILWQADLGTPVRRSQLPCGNMDPVGVTSTPVIDPVAWRVYVAAMTTPDKGVTKEHKIFALSLDDGSVVDGWPVNVNGLSFAGHTFNSTTQNQRSALLLSSGTLYVAYGGHWGDCGTYWGWVIGVPVDNPGNPVAWASRGRGGGTWAPSGPSTDGLAIFMSTGNTFGASSWMDGEAVIRFTDGPVFSYDEADYFAPSNWRSLDSSDLDIGGVGPVLIDIAGSYPSALAVALGKNGVGYLLDRNYLGGIGTGDGIHGEGLYSDRVSTSQIITAAAAYTAPSGTYVVFTTYAGQGVGCPGTPGNLVALQIDPGFPPTFHVAWCASNPGRGAPIVTTTDGTSEPVVWTVGAESGNRLLAFDGETGDVLFGGGGSSEQMSLVRRFQTPIAVNGRIFVAGDNELFAFTTQ